MVITLFTPHAAPRPRCPCPPRRPGVLAPARGLPPSSCRTSSPSSPTCRSPPAREVGLLGVLSVKIFTKNICRCWRRTRRGPGHRADWRGAAAAAAEPGVPGQGEPALCSAVICNINNFCNLGEGVPARWRGGEGGDPDRPLGHGPVPAVPAGRVHVQVSCDWSAGHNTRL